MPQYISFEVTVKIALFHSTEDHEIARAIGSIITVHEGIVKYYEEKTVWNPEFCRNPLALLDGVSHFIFLYSGHVSDLLGLFFLSGVCIGRDIPVIVIEIDGGLPIPEHCRAFGTILKVDDFGNYFLAEKDRFMLEDRKKQARLKLMEKGISCFDQNFIFIASSGDADAVELFLEAGFDPSIVDSKGNPLLSLAVRAQFPRVVTLLLESGEDINRLSGDRGYSPLMDAVQKGDIAMVKLLLEKGAEPDLRSKDGQTALVICAGGGDEEMAELLVSHGANPLIADRLGMSALAYAKLFNNRKMLELFNTTSA
jgi:hypothetical protein